MRQLLSPACCSGSLTRSHSQWLTVGTAREDEGSSNDMSFVAMPMLAGELNSATLSTHVLQRVSLEMDSSILPRHRDSDQLQSPTSSILRRSATYMLKAT